jgi:hypothetical protein
MRIRSVKPEFFTDRVTGRFPLELQMFYVALWCYADDCGRFEWEPDLIRCQLFPFHPDLAVGEMLRALVEAGRVVSYEVDGVRFGAIRSFELHQHPDKKKQSRLPAPPAGVGGGLKVVPDPSLTTPRPITAGEEGRGEEGSGAERGGDAAATRVGMNGSGGAAPAPTLAERFRCALSQRVAVGKGGGGLELGSSRALGSTIRAINHAVTAVGFDAAIEACVVDAEQARARGVGDISSVAFFTKTLAHLEPPGAERAAHDAREVIGVDANMQPIYRGSP